LLRQGISNFVIDPNVHFGGSTTLITNQNGVPISTQQPIELRWNPHEDITTFELAQAIPYILTQFVMPGEIDLDANFVRHFDVFDHNN